MSHEANATVVNPLPAPLRGSASVPGDKSISHRAVLFAAMAEGTSRLSGVLDSAATPAPRCACSWACWRRGTCAWS